MAGVVSVDEEKSPLLHASRNSSITSHDLHRPARSISVTSQDRYGAAKVRVEQPARKCAVKVSPGVTSKRQPVHYHSINPTEEARLPDNSETVLAVNRYKYYCRLAPHHDSSLLMPDHVVPAHFFLIIPRPAGSKQSSIITIFSIWNTMMGTSLLSIPWAIKEAGFGLGIGLMLFMAALAFYTALRISQSPARAAINSPSVEFFTIVRVYLGKWCERGSVFFSVMPLIGGAVVYWVLMSNFLYNVVVYIHDRIYGVMVAVDAVNDTYPGAYCPSMPIDVVTNTTPSSVWTFDLQPTLKPSPTDLTTTLFQKIWHQTNTVPFFLLLLLFPLINFKSPTFFTKFNTLGTVSVAYIIVFVSVKAWQWGIHLDFNATDAINVIPMYRWSFLALTGTCSLALFIHNCVLTILSMNERQENNGRDLFIAYGAVTITYLIIGVVFFIAFPFAKECIGDNLLNNIKNNDVLGFVARLFLLFQMTTVFPLLVYLLRAQLLLSLFSITEPSNDTNTGPGNKVVDDGKMYKMKYILLVNLVLVAVCILFARFLPNIGVIIRFTGAFCGLAYIFALPCIIYLLSLREDDKLTVPVVVVHSLIMLLGVANFIGQFIPV